MIGSANVAMSALSETPVSSSLVTIRPSRTWQRLTTSRANGAATSGVVKRSRFSFSKSIGGPVEALIAWYQNQMTSEQDGRDSEPNEIIGLLDS